MFDEGSKHYISRAYRAWALGSSLSPPGGSVFPVAGNCCVFDLPSSGACFLWRSLLLSNCFPVEQNYYLFHPKLLIRGMRCNQSSTPLGASIMWRWECLPKKHKIQCLPCWTGCWASSVWHQLWVLGKSQKEEVESMMRPQLCCAAVVGMLFFPKGLFLSFFPFYIISTF